MDLLHVFIGTKAQYIKTAPVLHELDRRSVPYRLIDTGQHARIGATIRGDLGVRAPDHVLGGDADVVTVPAAAMWSLRLASRLVDARRLRAEIFGGHGGICVVHGDTPSTVLAALLARRAGLRVAHLEAGLRSHNLLHPFPEEAIRLVVMRLSSLLFAPDETAAANLAAMRVGGRVVRVSGNTSIDAVRASAPAAGERGPVVVLMHRVENLHRRARLEGLVDLVLDVAAGHDVRFVVHGPTANALARAGADRRLRDAGVDLVPLMPHDRFVALLAAAPFVVIDGGSIQEECALLGVPTLVWRARTERPDGLGRNVVLAKYDPRTVADFLRDPERFRHPPAPLDRSPAEQIVETLAAALAERR